MMDPRHQCRGQLHRSLCLDSIVFRLSLATCIILFCCTFVHGSHYVKYHMHNYCDPSNSTPITLTPYSNMSVVLIKLKRESYRPNMECTIHLEAAPRYGLMAFFTKLKMRRFSLTKADKLEFTSGNLTLLRFYGANQEVDPTKTIISPHGDTFKSRLSIHFVSEPYLYTLPGKGFKIVVNLFSKANEHNECDAKLGLNFNCKNEYCIDESLECDGIDNCQNHVDEDECDETSETKLSLYVFLGTIGVMLVLILMFLKKTKERRREIVRRMSRVHVYSNNPILYVMESNGTGQSNADSLCNTPQLNNQDRLKRPASVRSKLSLSLPQGIDQLHTNNLNYML